MCRLKGTRRSLLCTCKALLSVAPLMRRLPLGCCPPCCAGATHERSFMALELLHLHLDAFGDLINPALVSTRKI